MDILNIDRHQINSSYNKQYIYRFS